MRLSAWRATKNERGTYRFIADRPSSGQLKSFNIQGLSVVFLFLASQKVQLPVVSVFDRARTEPRLQPGLCVDFKAGLRDHGTQGAREKCGKAA